MNSPAFDIKDMLAAESALALTYGTDLFIGSEPITPDNCVTIYDTPGLPDQLTMDNARYDYPSVQIRIRDNSYIAGYAVGEEIKTSLHGREHETWNGALYTVIRVINGPFLLKYDDNNRAIFVMNLDVQRR